MTDPTEPPERYTSYHSEKTFSILDKAREYAKHNIVFSFEYRGLGYGMTECGGGQMKLYRNGPKAKFLMPDSDTEDNPAEELPTGALARFPLTDFATFIRTYEIEGKTLEWILEHQREWKYQLTADQVADHVRGFNFLFVYRGGPCWINPSSKGGWYLYLAMGITFDVKLYAPLTPGAEHWSHRIVGVFYHQDEGPQICVGPYATPAALLDTVKFDRKTLREIFDTEYDDGEVLCGVFVG